MNYFKMNASPNNQYLKLLLIFCFVVIFISLRAQTTVYSNSFNTSENPLSVLNSGTPALTWTNVTTGTGIIRTANLPGGTNNYLLYISNANTIGRTYTTGNLSNFGSPYQKTLNTNTADISWSFNMRTNRSSSSIGFDVTNGYGSAVVLCATGSDLLTASGYAVTLMRGTTYNAVRLVKFTNGLSSNANITTIIGPSAESTVYTDYYSIKVIYSPSTNKWKLFCRIDGATVADPETGTYTRVGSETTDNTYTSIPMSYFGFFYNHQTTTGPYYACFDNFKVIHAPDTINTVVDTIASKLNIYTNLRYGNINDTSNPNRLLDLYVPASPVSAKLPTLVFIHGGGFSGGDKGDMKVLCSNIALKGYAVISMNYTLGLKNKTVEGSSCGDNMSKGLPPDGLFHPLLEQAIITASGDAVLALEWIKTNADTYHLDIDNVSVSGGSAGSMTALYTAYVSKQTVLPIRSVVDLWGGLENASHIEINSPPVITFHGDRDTIINVAYAYAIHNRLTELQKTNSSLNIMANKGHAEYSYITSNKVDQIVMFLNANKYVQITNIESTNNSKFFILRKIQGGVRIVAQKADVKLFDAVGKLLLTKKVIESTDIVPNKKGSYLLQIKTGCSMDTVKFLVS